MPIAPHADRVAAHTDLLQKQSLDNLHRWESDQVARQLHDLDNDQFFPAPAFRTGQITHPGLLPLCRVLLFEISLVRIFSLQSGRSASRKPCMRDLL